MRYIERLKAQSINTTDNALILGTALHTGIDKGVDAAVNKYYMSYPIITDDHVNEAIKLEYLIPLAKDKLPDGGKFEKQVSNDDFIGYLDYLVPVEQNSYDLYDFKYSNNTSNYQESKQLHIYKYFFELQNPDKRINELFYLMVPKVKIKRSKTESLEEYRRRIYKDLIKTEPFLVPVKYDFNKVTDFLIQIKRILESEDYPKATNYLCNYCEFQQFCEKGEDYMLLPNCERRQIDTVTKIKLWLYGAPFSGKTTFANKFPNPLIINTDGNISFVDAPYIAIKDDVKVEGRMTKRTLAWEVFKETIDELEKGGNEYKTIIVDLLEDLYEHCRLYMYQQMGISHESDDSFRAWDKVRVEFLSTLKRLMNLDYENIILISHEDTSKDITRKGGDKITAIKPNLQERTSNKVAGMVDIVARVVADGDTRTLSFKTNEVIFGGGRLTTSITEIPLDYETFITVYDEANKAAAGALKGEAVISVPTPAAETTKRPRGRPPKTIVDPDDGPLPHVNPVTGEVMDDSPAQTHKQPEPSVRTRKRRN